MHLEIGQKRKKKKKEKIQKRPKLTPPTPPPPPLSPPPPPPLVLLLLELSQSLTQISLSLPLSVSLSPLSVPPLSFLPLRLWGKWLHPHPIWKACESGLLENYSTSGLWCQLTGPVYADEAHWENMKIKPCHFCCLGIPVAEWPGLGNLIELRIVKLWPTQISLFKTSCTAMDVW